MKKVDFVRYADDNPPSVIGNGVKEVINYLTEALNKLFYCLLDSQMKVNSDKCNLLSSSSDKVSICVDNCNIKSSKCEKPVVIKSIRYKLNFNAPVDETCKNNNDNKSTFYGLLEKDGSVSIHKWNLRFIACEMLKLKRDMAPGRIKELILPNRQYRYELRHNPDFAVLLVKSVHKV